MKITPAPLTRDLSTIAREIGADYRKKGKPVFYAAVPYLTSLRDLHTRDLGGRYFQDTADDLVIRLLGNLSTWRGETATRVKAELKAALAWHKLTPAQKAAAQPLFTVVAEGTLQIGADGVVRPVRR